MSFGLYSDGVKDIYNVDFSEVVIQQMQMKYKMDEFPGLMCLHILISYYSHF